jgi:bifunctional DNase/RNase
MTHDLFREVLDDLGVSLERITVTELRDGVFHAQLELNARDGVHTVSSRPSDAIALAARTGSPIYASEAVLTDAGYIEDDTDADEEPEEVVEEFRAFIDSVNPEDFAS